MQMSVLFIGAAT